MAAAASETKESTTSASHYLASDAKLVERKAEMAVLHAKYSVAAPAATIDRLAATLETKNKYVVHNCATKADALRAVIGLLGEASSFGLGGVQSLEDIGFNEWAKTQTAHTNYKALQQANYGKPDYAKYAALGATADFFITAPSALSETGDLVWASATSSRVSLFAKKTVFIVGANKIVPTEADGLRRLYEYCKPLVGARTRALYGAPDTFIMETGLVSGGNPFNPGQIVVILCKEPLGY